MISLSILPTHISLRATEQSIKWCRLLAVASRILQKERLRLPLLPKWRLNLSNVAKASLQELLLDYEDFLRVRNLALWDVNSEKAKTARNVCSRHNDSLFYLDAIRHRSPETIANIAITIIHQTDVFLRKLIERLQQDFLHNGGIKEQMYRARINYRNRHES